MNRTRLVAGMLLPLLLSTALAQVPALPVLDDKPTPQVDAGGPSAAVTCLAFSPDGKTLYAAGLDKVVRVWTLQNSSFVLKTTYRVPLGPGNTGALNAVALSPDGAWVAMAGRAPIRGEAGFRQQGLIVDAATLTPEHNKDVGVIYVVRTGKPAGGKVLRGHRGEVRALAFAPPSNGQPALLVSAAIERDGAKRFGGLRLWQWDEAKGEFQLLAEHNKNLPAIPGQPGLAVWRTGPGPLQIRVAVTWPVQQPRKLPLTNDYLYVWEVDKGRLPARESDPFTQTVQRLSQDGKILTGGFEVKPGGRAVKGGRLREWDFKTGLLRTVAEFPQRNGVYFVPLSLAVVPPSHAAVVLMPTNNENYGLALVDLKANRVVAERPLAGSDRTQLPAIAASGQHLAVAAMRDRGIRVYTVADLLNGQQAAPQVLRSAGLALRQTVFVEKGFGLWLGKAAGAPDLSGGWVFDLNQRQFRTNNRAVLADAPAQGAWKVTINQDKKGVTVVQGQKAMPPVRLPENVWVTEAQLRPAAQGLPDILAVAYTELAANRPLILLCNPADGKPYRLLTGHRQSILGLAFSASRPLLASVGDDQTVCVWSLADINSAVGEVPGLGVSDKVGKNGNEVVVRSVEAGSAAAAKLATGDVLHKLGVPGGKARAIKDAVGFLLEVYQHKPGDEVKVTVAGKGVVTLKVQRGVDWRNPLFSLFLKDNLDWVGWSPAGPYDCRDAAAEALLGWHTNTGDPAAPVSYAPAAAYRKNYYHEGILRYLAQEADLGRALKEWKKANPPPPPPKAALYFLRPDGVLPTPQPEQFLVRQAMKFLGFGINPDYPLDDEHVLRWRLLRTDGGIVQANAREASGKVKHTGKEWQVALPGVDWRRGEYQLRVGLHARADAPELASSTVRLRFQPPPPKLSLSLAGKAVATTEKEPLKVAEDQLTVQVHVEPSLGQKVKVQFEQSCNGLPEKKPLPAMDKQGRVNFLLRKGLSRLTVHASNEDALPGFEDDEKTTAEVWVRFQAPDEKPPRFLVLELDPDPVVKRLGGKDVWVVSKAAPVLTVQVEADGILKKADLLRDDGEPQSLLGPNGKKLGPKGGEVSVQLKELTAGKEVRLRLVAKSANSDENRVERWLVFHPPPPAITSTLKIHDELLRKVVLKGTFEQTKFPFDLRFQVTSSAGKVSKFEPKVNLAAGTWAVELLLFPGSNTVESFVKNQWHAERAAEEALELRYRRPPRIANFPKQVMAVDTNRVKLELTVESPADRPLLSVLVDNNPVRFDPPKLVGANGDYSVWKVQIPEVFVNDGGKNLASLSVQVVSDDGASKAKKIGIVHVKTPPVPRASFISPVATDTARRPEYPVRFRVESELPLERIEISGGARMVILKDQLKNVKPEGKVYFLPAEVVLKNGVNTLKLIAVNTKGGQSPPAEVVVSYTEPAVRIDIDRIAVEIPGKQKLMLAPQFAANGDRRFPKVPSSLVWLAGRVSWSDPKAKALDHLGLEVVVKVGDCRQFPVQLLPRGLADKANVREFLVPVVLIGAVNKITVEVPSLPQQELSSPNLVLNCAKPARQQRLHVLIIGVNVKDAKALKNRVLDALGVAPGDRPPGVQGEFKRKPPFDQCVLYRVLAGTVDKNEVIAQLAEINSKIQGLEKDTKWLNDLVLIYYQGEDWQPTEPQRKQERWLKMSKNFKWRDSPVETFALACHALPRVPGAPLLLLNVTGQKTSKVAGSNWGGDPDTGFIRYAMDAAEMGKADPALLRGLQKATSQKDRLGEVVNFVNANLGLQPLVVLNQDQQNRQIGEGKKKE